jgi:hypothetical protein
MITKVSKPAQEAFQKDSALEEQKRDIFGYHEYHRIHEGPGFSTITIPQSRRRRNQDG